MKKLIATLCLTALATGAFAQGLVKFQNSTTTTVGLVSTGGTIVAAPGSALTAPNWYYALLAAPSGTANPHEFTFAGLYATNTTSAGRLQGGLLSPGVAAQNWAAGETKSFLVAGWSADNGNVWNPAWIAPGNVHLANGDFAGTPLGWFGVSTIGTGVAGGPDSNGNNLPTLALFGALPSINTGFTMVQVPEPATMALAGLGAAALLIFRRRK
jgi:hypothetical protein